MKKVILTFLGVFLSMQILIAQPQDDAIVINESQCDLLIEFLYADELCATVAPTTGPILVKTGTSALSAISAPASMVHITGVRIWRVVTSPWYVCPQVYLMSPPATCGSCNLGEPSTISIPASGDCCQTGVIGTWTEISCSSSGQSTELIFN